jgi:site-specific DNA-methyltransferase (adenine-specific)
MGRQDYQWKHELCLYGWKNGAAHYFIDDRTQSTVFEDLKPKYTSMKKAELIKLLDEIYSDKESTTVINEHKPNVNDIHPTMKPIKLFARLVKNSSKVNEKVLDVFGGSGTALITCEQLDRKSYTMEFDPRYVDATIDRWERFTGNKAELIEGEEND